MSSAAVKRTSHGGAAAASGVPTKLARTGREEYPEGAVMRVKFKNFVTYNSVEFCPGPNLNVVIGPNGTGKSTIISGICLGLAGPTRLLGRQSAVGDFVKTGEDSGTIELELCRHDEEENLIIERTITKTNQSTWRMNGRVTSESKVKEEIRKMNIQIDNLCQFLPQDKVPEFAKMNKVELLTSTQRAVKGEEMVKKHEALIEFSKAEVTMKKALEEDLAHKDKLEKQNMILKPQVELYQEREKQARDVKCIEQKIAWVDYEESRSAYVEKKNHYDALKDRVKEAQKATAPSLQALEAAKSHEKRVGEEKSDLSKEVAALYKKAENAAVKIDEAVTKVDEAQQEIKSKRKAEKERANKMEALREEIRQYEKELQQLANEEEDIEPQLQALKDERTAVSNRIRNTQMRLSDIQGQRDHLVSELRPISSQIKTLEDAKSRRENYLKDSDRDTFQALKWLRDNQAEFEEPIFEPIFMLIEMKETKHAKFIENVVRKPDLFAFVAQNSRDQEKFLKLIRDEQKLRINCVLAPKNKNIVRETPDDIKRRFGFVAFLDELFDCPKPVKDFLCGLYYLHETPLGSAKTEKAVDQVMAEPWVHTFFLETSKHTVTTSRYGDRARSTRIAQVREAQVLKTAVDVAALGDLKREESEKKRQFDKLGEETKVLSQQEAQDRQKDTDINKKMTDLKNRKNARSNIQAKLTAKQGTLANMDKAVKVAKEQAEQAQAALEHATKQAAHLATQGRNNLRDAAALSRKECLKFMEVLDAAKQVKVKAAEMTAANERLKQLEHELETTKAEVQSLKDEAKAKLEKARESTGGEIKEEHKNIFTKYPDDIEALRMLHAEEKAKLDCSASVNKQVIDDYRAREEEIKVLNEKITQMQSDYDKHIEAMTKTHNEWYPELTDLIQKINISYSEFFKKLDCAGEVRLYAPERDYANYGIEIRVKFRAEEQLQLLTAHHQSGGERAVSTMLYLMALQALTTCPFRVVDEINQGMDPINERRVFTQVVNCSTSEERTSQYFLVTPKLLTDLTYNDKTRILCVYNGINMLSHTQWDLGSIIARRKALRS